MSLSYVYKRFKPEDKAITPFNAHKQYNLTSASAVTQQISYFNTSYTSESISLYSSASATYGGDTKNVVKYNQLDHLFYRDYLKKIHNKKDLTNYKRQSRKLYEKANILSIPAGLYGAEIKKTSFYLSSSIYEITDDSYGNLIISGTDVSNYPIDPYENVFSLGPVKGHKKYDLEVYDGYVKVEGRESIGNYQYIHTEFWRRGSENPGAPTTYTSDNKKLPLGYFPKDEDDSYFFHELNYNNVTFQKSTLGHTNHKFSSINFNSATASYIKVPHDYKLNLNTNRDYSISFYINPQETGSQATEDLGFAPLEKRYILAKSTTYTKFSQPPGFAGAGTEVATVSSSLPIESPVTSNNFPFEIYMQSQSLYFARSDGDQTHTINCMITGSGGTCQQYGHILCQVSSSVMQIWFNGNKEAEATSNLNKSTKNKANLYIGSKGIPTDLMSDDTGASPYRYFNGELNNINIFTKSFNTTEITNISESINGSPYIGNLFYRNGFATITHPSYYGVVSGSTSPSQVEGGIDTLQFQGTHLIYEHEYQCTIDEYEFNTTLNKSAINSVSNNPFELENFTTSSYFKPFVTTIGLYNDAYELLAVGKLGQPIRCSDETDTTFIIRFDE